MKNPSSDTICRTCMTKGQNCHSVLEYESMSKLRISEMLMTTVPQLHIQPEDDRLPMAICGVCLNKLNIAYHYHQLCIQTDRSLKAVMLHDKENADDVERHLDHLNIETKQKKLLLRKEITPDPLVHNDSCIKIENESECREFLSDHEDDRDCFAKNMAPTKTREDDGDPHNYNGNESDVEQNDKIYVAEYESKEFLSDHEKDRDGIFKAAAVDKTLAKIREDGGDVESDKAEIPDVRYPCPDCLKDFDRKYRLQRHIVVHSITRLHICDICKYRFPTENHLKRHKNTHRKDDSAKDGFKCPECLQRFEKRASLSAHLRGHRRAIPKQMFPCEYCPKKFIKISLLKKHTRVHPENQQKFKCHFCGKVFHQNSTLNEHINTHTGETPHLCSQCGRSFAHSGALRQHILRHSDEKRFRCEKCLRRFVCPTNLRKHMLVHRAPICDICGSKFSSLNKLKEHKKTHSGDCPYKCKECNMSFVLRDNLHFHMSKHTKQKRYKCKYCDQTYTRSGVLQKHLRLHVGENTYMCDECPSAFKYKKELQLHKTQHFKLITIELE